MLPETLLLCVPWLSGMCFCVEHMDDSRKVILEEHTGCKLCAATQCREGTALRCRVCAIFLSWVLVVSRLRCLPLSAAHSATHKPFQGQPQGHTEQRPQRHTEERPHHLPGLNRQRLRQQQSRVDTIKSRAADGEPGGGQRREHSTGHGADDNAKGERGHYESKGGAPVPRRHHVRHVRQADGDA